MLAVGEGAVVKRGIFGINDPCMLSPIKEFTDFDYFTSAIEPL